MGFRFQGSGLSAAGSGDRPELSVPKPYLALACSNIYEGKKKLLDAIGMVIGKSFPGLAF